MSQNSSEAGLDRYPVDFEPFCRLKAYSGALEILNVLKRAGYQAFLAGGCVRDLWLKREPKDFDIASSATPQQVLALFPRTIPIGEKFGTVGVLTDEVLYQVTTFRSEGPYLDGRHPESVSWSGPREDAVRRDFTINGLFADPPSKEILDYVGGIADLKKQILRAIGDPKARFREDALRMMRAVRFSNRFHFPIEEKTQEAIHELAPSILRVSPERIRDELVMILTEAKPAEGIEALSKLNLLQAILPEVEAMKGVQQPPQFHPEGDVYVHTLLVLEKLESRDPILVMAALLHDVGKPPTFEIADRIRFNGHAALGAKMGEEILRRLAFSNSEIETVSELIKDHLHIADLPKMREAKRRRFLRRPTIEAHLTLHKADCLGSHGLMDIYKYCREQLEKLSQEALHPPKLVDGKDLIEMGYPPGPVFKKILFALEEEQLEGRIHSKPEALSWVKKEFPKSG